jgi:hypothetical protein
MKKPVLVSNMLAASRERRIESKCEIIMIMEEGEEEKKEMSRKQAEWGNGRQETRIMKGREK